MDHVPVGFVVRQVNESGQSMVDDSVAEFLLLVETLVMTTDLVTVDLPVDGAGYDVLPT